MIGNVGALLHQLLSQALSHLFNLQSSILWFKNTIVCCVASERIASLSACRSSRPLIEVHVSTIHGYVFFSRYKCMFSARIASFRVEYIAITPLHRRVPNLH